MIISRTPLRISFFGGGTDYPEWLKKHKGTVLSTSIDKYIYISCRYFPPFFDYNINLTYSRIENCNRIEEIKHPSIKACLHYLDIHSNIEINHNSDLPGKSGLGSSSSFTVGLLHALHGYKREMVAQLDLAKEAIHVEQNIINENVGKQDQYATALGGLNLFEFNGTNETRVTKVILSQERINELKNHLLLFHTGITRYASEVAGEQNKNTDANSEVLKQMYAYVYEALEILQTSRPIEQFGELLHKNWILKKNLSSKITNNKIEQIYQKALEAGALGGKLLGAGSGGCFLIFANPKNHKAIIEILLELIYVPFDFENEGTKIIFMQK